MEMKECKARRSSHAVTTQVYCGEEKPITEFYMNGSGALDGQCKKCKNKSTVLRKKENPLASEASYIRNSTRNRLKGNGWSGRKDAERFNKMLGCDYRTFRDHIESTFKEGMSWDNMDKWQLDHIMPLGSAKSIKELHELAHYTNIQALYPLDNIRKSNSVFAAQYLEIIKQRTNEDN